MFLGGRERRIGSEWAKDNRTLFEVLEIPSETIITWLNKKWNDCKSQQISFLFYIACFLQECVIAKNGYLTDHFSQTSPEFLPNCPSFEGRLFFIKHLNKFLFKLSKAKHIFKNFFVHHGFLSQVSFQQKQPPELFYKERCSSKISQNSQEHTCTRISFQ